LAVAVSPDFGHDQWVCAGVGGGILRKPVNRPDFLAALDCQIERLETKPS
jgi:hypothetical protein